MTGERGSSPGKRQVELRIIDPQRFPTPTRMASDWARIMWTRAFTSGPVIAVLLALATAASMPSAETASFRIT